jgi:eukaryotic-like serine/threonine-protein kinase
VAPPLTDDRWRRLEALFLAGAELPPGERDDFVARETAGDPGLARELAGMLAHASDGGPRIARAIEDVAGEVSAPDDWVGRRFGAYRVVREIGRGGMGLVFEAVRDDDEYRKTVALKVAPFWRDRSAVTERFRLERQILAELEHPHIARFLDGGTEDGVPYFVMEYVEGLPITAYCGAHHLDLTARLALFRQVCGAVQFAHESLVVHRDLKPANILVSDAGEPKLLDFGIAKLLDPLSEAGSTATIETRWTPDYTSPEQVRGRAVTVRTDVYSLGLILYELLTGQRAQIADPTSPLTLDRSICEIEPPRPSERALTRRDRALASQLRGDLDTIVMTAVSKEPDRRYGTAAAFSDDLGRFLDGRPILARPSTAGYRAGKFLRRHWVGAGAVALIVVSLVGGLGAALFEARRAERRFQQVRALANAFVFDVHDRIQTLPGSTEARKAIVQTALIYLESLHADAGGDESLARELAAAYEKIGHAQGDPLTTNLGDTAGAIASFTRAQEILAPIARRGDRPARRQLVSISAALANVHQAKGDVKSATADLLRGEDLGEQLLLETPDDRVLIAALADIHGSAARAAIGVADNPRAEREARRCVALTTRLVQFAPADRDHRDHMASAYNALGQVLEVSDRLPESAEQFRAGIAIREQLVADAPDNVDYRHNLMIGYGNLGDVLGFLLGHNLGDISGSEAAFDRAVAIAEWERQHDPADRRASFDLVNAKLRLGNMIVDNSPHLEDGLRQLREADRVNGSLLAADPQNARYAYLAVTIDHSIGNTLLKLGQTADAVHRFESARAAAGRLLNGPTSRSARSQYIRLGLHLALVRATAGDPRAADLAEEASRELATKPLGTAFEDATGYAELGKVYAQLAKHSSGSERADRRRKAIATLEKSRDLWRSWTVTPAVEPRRQRELAAVEAALAECVALRPS